MLAPEASLIGGFCLWPLTSKMMCRFNDYTRIAVYLIVRSLAVVVVDFIGIIIGIVAIVIVVVLLLVRVVKTLHTVLRNEQRPFFNFTSIGKSSLNVSSRMLYANEVPASLTFSSTVVWERAIEFKKSLFSTLYLDRAGSDFTVQHEAQKAHQNGRNGPRWTPGFAVSKKQQKITPFFFAVAALRMIVGHREAQLFGGIKTTAGGHHVNGRAERNGKIRVFG